jgi:hypothetical protein
MSSSFTCRRSLLICDCPGLACGGRIQELPILIGLFEDLPKSALTKILTRFGHVMSPASAARDQVHCPRTAGQAPLRVRSRGAGHGRQCGHGPRGRPWASLQCLLDLIGASLCLLARASAISRAPKILPAPPRDS